MGAPLPPPLKGWVVVVARHTLAPRWWRKLVLMARKRFARGGGVEILFLARGQGVPEEAHYCCNPLVGGAGRSRGTEQGAMSMPHKGQG